MKRKPLTPQQLGWTDNFSTVMIVITVLTFVGFILMVVFYKPPIYIPTASQAKANVRNADDDYTKFTLRQFREEIRDEIKSQSEQGMAFVVIETRFLSVAMSQRLIDELLQLGYKAGFPNDLDGDVDYSQIIITWQEQSK